MKGFTTALSLLTAIASSLLAVNAADTPPTCMVPCIPKDVSVDSAPDALTNVICKDQATFKVFTDCVEKECKSQPTPPDMAHLTWENVCLATGEPAPPAANPAKA